MLSETEDRVVIKRDEKVLARASASYNLRNRRLIFPVTEISRRGELASEPLMFYINSSVCLNLTQRHVFLGWKCLVNFTVLYREFGEGNGTPLQYFCLENPMDGGTWWAALYGVTQSRTRLKRLSSSSSSIQRVGLLGDQQSY